MGEKERSALTEPMFYILMSFLKQERCGTEITEYVARKTGGRIHLDPGTLYTLLGKFQDERLIEESSVAGRKRTYRLTEKGRKAYREELERLKTCVRDGEEALL
ncbi:PadR family transcriptional regulator [Gemmiger formicilis]|uniref:PadR family transcriptional regulator n=1 Tax=Gemmiger formicilis TaxID=745368 RepID=UPI0031F669F9